MMICTVPQAMASPASRFSFAVMEPVSKTAFKGISYSESI